MVLALVLDWNGLSFTRGCCAALARQTLARGIRVLVVDNGSAEHGAAELRDACPGAEVVRAPRNLGFAGGVAWGLAHGKSAAEPFSHLWILDNDAQPAPGALAAMLATARGRPRLAAVGCPLAAPYGRHAAATPGALRLRGPLWVPRPGEPPDFLCGASLLVPRAALVALGPPDPAFPFYFADADWCFRARAAGWELAVAPDARVVHLGSATVGRAGAARSALYREGWVKFLRRHAPHPFLSSIPATAWRVLADVARGRFSDAGGTVRGWVRGWRGSVEPPHAVDAGRAAEQAASAPSESLASFMRK